MNTLLLIVRLLPAIIEAIKAIEAAIPERGKGNEKQSAVLGIIADTVDDASKMLPAIANVITRVVGLFNATGVFQKAETTQ